VALSRHRIGQKAVQRRSEQAAHSAHLAELKLLQWCALQLIVQRWSPCRRSRPPAAGQFEANWRWPPRQGQAGNSTGELGRRTRAHSPKLQLAYFSSAALSKTPLGRRTILDLVSDFTCLTAQTGWINIGLPPTWVTGRCTAEVKGELHRSVVARTAGRMVVSA